MIRYQGIKWSWESKRGERRRGRKSDDARTEDEVQAASKREGRRLNE